MVSVTVCVCCVCIGSEQRVTGILVFVMVGLSALMADLLKVLLSFSVYFVFVFVQSEKWLNRWWFKCFFTQKSNPSVFWHCWLDMRCWYHVCKTKDIQTSGFSCIALTLQVERQEGHPAHINPVVIPVSLVFVRAPAHLGYPGLKGCKTVVCLFIQKSATI